MFSPRLLLLSATLAAFALLPGNALAAPTQAPTPLRPVDASQLFVGRWIEIGP
jgi:hypothetical protein